MLSQTLTSFTWKLYKDMTNGKDENYFVSPFSIACAMTMCRAGSRNETAAQLKAALCLPHELNNDQIDALYEELHKKLNSSGEQDLALLVANKMYPTQLKDFILRPEFRNTIEKKYHGEVQALDFGDASKAVKTINDWVAEKTRDKIQNLLAPSSVSGMTRLVLVNAVYFKGKWQHAFEKEKTTKEDFQLKSGSSVKVDMMKETGLSLQLFKHPHNLKATVCELPYKTASSSLAVAMTIILPDQGVSLDAIERQMSDKILADLLANNKQPPKLVDVYLPRFKLDFKQELSSNLANMGAKNVFDAGKADLTGISEQAAGLFVSQVVHNAVVDVNEEGTEAAAATAILMELSCVMPSKRQVEVFRCDRPFLFVIHEKKTKSVLFLGKLTKP